MTNSQLNTNLLGSINRYLKYSLNINPGFELNSFPVNYEHFSFDSFLNSVKKLSYFDGLKLNNTRMYSLHYSEDKDARTYWKDVTDEIFNQKIIGQNIFLYNSGLDGEKNELVSPKSYETLEATDQNFCHSRLMRDFFKKHKIGFEIDLGLPQDPEQKEESKPQTTKCNGFADVLNEKVSKYLDNEQLSYDYKSLLKLIIKSFNDYFTNSNSASKNLLSCVHFIKYLTDFYAYNLNSEAFAGAKKDDEIITGIKLSDITTGHELCGTILNKIKESPFSSDVNQVAKWKIYLDILSDLTRLLVYHNKIDMQVKILLLDDHPQNVKDEITQLKNWLGEKVEIHNEFNEGNENLSIKEIDDLFSLLDSKKVKDDGQSSQPENPVEMYKNNIDQKDYDFILIDLDYEGELKGFEYLRKLRTVKSVYDKPFVIVFSRVEDSVSVQKALNMGALSVVSKQNFAHLILEIFKVLPLISKIDSADKTFSLGNNWNLLYQLPLAKILELRTAIVEVGEIYMPYENKNKNYGFDEDNLITNKDYLWIKELPKAELHNHIGSALGPDLIPQTALVVLSKYYNSKIVTDKTVERIRKIVEFLIPVTSDPFLSEKEEDKTYGKFPLLKSIKSRREKYKNKKWYQLKKTLAIDYQNQFYNQSVFSIVSNTLNLEAHSNKTPEEVLLSPQDDTLEKNFKPFSRLSKSNYFKIKLDLREMGVSYDEIMLFFILLLNLREKKKNKNSAKEILEDIKQQIKLVFDQKLNNNISITYPEVELNNFIYLFASSTNIKSLGACSKGILKFLISAHSPQRCLKFHNRGLFNYLRGCEYGGAPHLQCPESIFLAAHHIVFNYAIPDNIRYLDLRCAVDGYNKFGLFNKDENKPLSEYNAIIKTLKESFDFWKEKAKASLGKNVHVNLIITAKRHKSIKDFEKNVEITLNNFKLHQISEFESKNSFFNTAKPEVVSFDIAGLEKNNRISKFREQITPLLEKCVPITMHAGEEDSHEAIWEAFYIGHTQRIGHALTLGDNKNLKNLVRESIVNIELCPLSNYLTNNKYTFKDNEIKNYPLRGYLEDRISVSINTDNPYVSDSTLTKEFLFASKMYGGLTRWQILKLILYSFKSITIHKKLKSILIKEINEEIFKLMLEESELC